MAIGNNSRERALGVVTEAAPMRRGRQVRNASTLGRTPIVDRAFNLFPAPSPLPIREIPLRGQRWDTYKRNLHGTMARIGHPLRGRSTQRSREVRTSVYFADLLNDVVLDRALRLGQNGLRVDFGLRLRVDRQLDRPNQQPRILLTGDPDLVIMHGADVVCVVELKAYKLARGYFETGRRQALLYAAIIGYQTHSTVHAIVCDMHRWLLLRVSRGTIEEQWLSVDWDRRDGGPNMRQFETVLRRVCGLLAHRP